MLKVTKLPPGITEETLLNVFENTRKFGGGDVEQVDYDEETNSAIITFFADSAVEKVLQKKPILLNKKIIEVEAYVINLEPPMEDSGEETEVSFTIEVRAIKPSTTEDTILYYFESKRGANADVEKIEFVVDKNMYLLTFENDAAVERALSKNHVLDGAQLQVEKHFPPKRYPNKTLVKGQSEKTSRDGDGNKDVLLPGIIDPVELESLLKQGGTYKSFKNKIYLAGACSAGKSTLASLLIGEEIPLEWKSTDGLKIFFGRNGIHLEDRKMVPLGKDKGNHNIISDILRGQPKLDKSQPDITQSHPYMDKEQPAMWKSQPEEDFSISKSEHNNTFQRELIAEKIKIHDKKSLGYNLIHDGLKQELKKGEYKVKIAPSDLVDFGGQKTYDMTHQLFIQGKGTFTLIFDGRKGLRDPLKEYLQGDVTTESILKHWVDSILTYCGEDDGDILPIILFVATHKDKLTEDEQVYMMTEFKQGLKEMFHNHEREDRIKYDDIFFINARNRNDPEVLRLQTTYVNIAFKQKSWGSEMPMAWVPLELQIMEKRLNNINIISKDDIVKINSENDDLKLTPKQLEDFLRSQHLLGNIMYFESQGLEKFIILQPTFLVDILRSFITDKMFFPSDTTLRQILNEITMTGKIRKQDLFKLWKQDQFNQHMPDDSIKQFVAKVLVHLDFLVEPKHYNTREDASDFYLVPCAVNRKPATDFCTHLENNKTLCLSYKLKKSSIPSALSFKLIGAAMNVWPLKETEKGVFCLYYKAAILCIDNINTLYLLVQNDRVIVYLTNERSTYFIPPDIASCVQECLTLTLTTSLEFYHNSFGKVVQKVTIAKLFEIEVVQKCGTEICYTPLTDINMKKPPWKCSLDREHETKFPMYWTYKIQKKECGVECQGLEEQCLILCPEDKHLARLARHIGMSAFYKFVITLKLSMTDWEDFEYKYHGRDPMMLKHDILCYWKQSTDKPHSLKDLQEALETIGYNKHILCQIFREDTAIIGLRDNILLEVPDDDTLLNLSEKLINCAIHLGVELGIDFCQIAETMEKYNREMSKQNNDILMKWKNSTSSQNKTIRYLMHVLKIVCPRGCTFLKKKYDIVE